MRVCVCSGRQCSILISRVEPISCLAYSLNVTGDFSSLVRKTGIVSEPVK